MADDVKPMRLRQAKKPVILKTADGKFMCRSDYALDVAFMLNCAEGILANYHMIDRLQLGELLVDYLDGGITPDDVRREIKECAVELDEDAELQPTKRSGDAHPSLEPEGGRADGEG